MSEYTPTTADIREQVAWQFDAGSVSETNAFAAFDRWLAAHEREVAATAIEAAREDVPPLPSGHQRSYVKHWLRDRAATIREGK